MRRLIARLDAALLRGYNLIMDTHFYWKRGHTLRAAWFLARNTL